MDTKFFSVLDILSSLLFSYLRLSQFPWFAFLHSRLSSTIFSVFLHRSYILDFPEYHCSLWTVVQFAKGNTWCHNQFPPGALTSTAELTESCWVPREKSWCGSRFCGSEVATEQEPHNDQVCVNSLQSALGENLKLKTRCPMLYGLTGITSG